MLSFTNVSFMRSAADFGNNIITKMDNIAMLVRNSLSLIMLGVPGFLGEVEAVDKRLWTILDIWGSWHLATYMRLSDDCHTRSHDDLI